MKKIWIALVLVVLLVPSAGWAKKPIYYWISVPYCNGSKPFFFTTKPTCEDNPFSEDCYKCDRILKYDGCVKEGEFYINVRDYKIPHEIRKTSPVYELPCATAFYNLAEIFPEAILDEGLFEIVVMRHGQELPSGFVFILTDLEGQGYGIPAIRVK